MGSPRPIKVAEASVQALHRLPSPTRSALILAAAFSGAPERTTRDHMDAWLNKVNAVARTCSCLATWSRHSQLRNLAQNIARSHGMLVERGGEAKDL